MKFSLKRMVSVILAVALLSSIGVMAYTQTFNPPKQGSGRVIESKIADGSMSPYVYQNVYSTETIYVLTPSSSYTYSVLATNLMATSIPKRLNLTYNTGYGAAGMRLYLQGCPSVTSFSAYTVSGTWGA